MKAKNETNDIYNYFLVSLALHVGIIGSILLVSWLLTVFKIPIPLLMNKEISIAQSAVRVDVVSMPKMTLKELENMTPSGEEGKKEEAPPAPTPAPVKEEPKPDDQAFLKEKKQKNVLRMVEEIFDL